ncbi:Probable envelope ADP,ATP carrier protein, chloroplastic [Olea europaea subsp. europaea]|uniref:Probable envelope ADP,ATP carrier protein, chloroplastic n=1 Tax=Olea europaea subsp. europaea TaxID=158383 RepID=A0A8S0RKM7_OLEEU|nr:Probable envelope ADP,ATP carrier protein, chloroplastic [Olea europaea subsp. europaea]
MDNILATLVWPEIRDLDPTNLTGPDQCGRNGSLKIQIPAAVAVGVILHVFRLQKREEKEFWPTLAQLVKNPLALVPKDTALFAAGAIAGAAIKTVTTSLDRIKLLMKISRETENQCLGE